MTKSLTASRPDTHLPGEDCRLSIRNAVASIADNVSEPAFEIRSGEFLPAVVSWWSRGSDWASNCPRGSFILGEGSFGASRDSGGPMLGIWLFGPEMLPSPRGVFLIMASHIAIGGRAVVATELPCRAGKLPPGQFGQYTSEEVASFFVRAGLSDDLRYRELDGCGLWSAIKSGEPDSLALSTATERLADGDVDGATRALMLSPETCVDSARMVERALLFAACHDLAGRSRACEQSLLEARDIDPGCARALCGLGRLALRGDHLEAACELFHDALTLEPALVAALRGMAVVCEMMGKTTQSYDCYLAAARLRPVDEWLACQAVRIGRALDLEREAEGLVFRRGTLPPACVA